MTHSFWHSGILIGDADVTHPSGEPGQFGGMFLPTAYGRTVMPRLARMLTVGHALKVHIESQGRSVHDLSPDEVDAIVRDSDAGRALMDLGRAVSEVEVRDANGVRVDFLSLSFSDVEELARTSRALGLGHEHVVARLPPDAPRYIVSVTFKPESKHLVARERSGKQEFLKRWRDN